MLELRSGPAYLGELGVTARRECSEETSRKVDVEIQRLLSEAEARVHATLTARIQELGALASMLLRLETVEREILVRLLAAAPGAREESSAAEAATREAGEVHAA